MVKENKVKKEENKLSLAEEKETKSSGKAGQKTQNKNKNKSIEDLVKESIELSQLVFKQNKKIKRRLNWMLFGSYLKLLIIIVPLIIGYIYLQPFLEQIIQQYQQLLGISSGLSPIADVLQAPNNAGADGISDILSNVSSEQLENLLKTFQR